MTKIRIFTDFSIKPTKSTLVSFVLYDWWQGLFKVELDFHDKSEFRDTDRFEGLIATCRDNFDYLTEPDGADYAVLPCDWKYFVRAKSEDLAFQFLRNMKDKAKMIIVQYNCDDDLPLEQLSSKDSPFTDNVILLRTSFNVSSQMPNEHAMPGFIGDPIKTYCKSKIPLRRKNQRPTVSFCGQVGRESFGSGQLDTFYQCVDNLFQGVEESSKNNMIYSFRATVLDNLSKSNKVETEIIRRNGYCAGIDKDHDTAGLVKVRREYYSNMINSDYVVCIRGKGNYSYRFYEALALGRIPIFVDTDSPLPFSNTINWNKHCVRVNHRSIMEIGDIVASHYAELSSDCHAYIQEANRKLFETLLTPEKYFPVLMQNLAK